VIGEVEALLRYGEVLPRIGEPHFEIAERPVQHRFGVQALHLDARAVGEDLEDRQPARIALHRARIERGEVAQRAPVGTAQRHAQVATDSHLGESSVRGEQRRDVVLVQAELARDHALTGSTRKRKLHVRLPVFSAPVRDRLHAILRARELGDERLVDMERDGEVLDQVAHEVEAGLVGRGLDDRPERELGVPLLESVRGVHPRPDGATNSVGSSLELPGAAIASTLVPWGGRPVPTHSHT
jgi:hypothetical protein